MWFSLILLINDKIFLFDVSSSNGSRKIMLLLIYEPISSYTIILVVILFYKGSIKIIISMKENYVK